MPSGDKLLVNVDKPKNGIATISPMTRNARTVATITNKVNISWAKGFIPRKAVVVIAMVLFGGKDTQNKIQVIGHQKRSAKLGKSEKSLLVICFASLTGKT